MYQLILNISSVANDAGTWIALVLLASAMEWRVKRLEREVSIERSRRVIMEGVRNGN